MAGYVTYSTSYEPTAMYEQVPIVWDHAKNATVWDTNGNEYIDFTSGIFVANVGHSNVRVMNAIRAQLSKGLVHSYVFPNESRQRLVKKLCEMTGFEKVFLLSTGSEAVEAAIRMARHYTGKPQVISWLGCMHGKTLGSQELMHSRGGHVWQLGDPVSKLEWGPLTVRSKQVAAAIVETYHGWGALWYPKQYIQDLAAWCKENGVLLIFDEVQAGFGRTGKLFGYEHYDVIPDMVVCGKALGNGLPISAVLGPSKVLDADPSLTSTHSGNPVCCAAALATLEVLEEESLQYAAANMGNIIWEAIYNLKGHREGHGAAWALWLDWPDPRKSPQARVAADHIVELAAECGLLLLKTGAGTIKIGPPLTIPEKQLKQGLDILEECVREVMA